MTVTIGIDPGLKGAIALVGTVLADLVAVFDMPVAGGAVSAQLLFELAGWRDPGYGTVVVEDVHSMPKQGVSSVFSFGRSKGVVEGVFAACRRPIVYVSPAAWKRGLGLGKDKGEARQRACELWPAKAGLFARVRDDGRAEAALIAYYWITKKAGS